MMEKKMLIAGLAVMVGMSAAVSFAEQPMDPQGRPLEIMENPVERPLKAEPRMTDETKAGKEKNRDAADVLTEHEKDRMELRQTKVQPKTENRIEPKDQQ